MPLPDLSAMRRWPNVPACYGWLSLDRRGQWRLRGETLTHRGLREFLSRQYTHDESGRYFVQNGPQRVFVALEYTPWVLHLAAKDRLETHTGEADPAVHAAAVDDEGNLLLELAQGIALLCDRDLPALLRCLHRANGEVADEASVLAAMQRSPAEVAALFLDWQGKRLPLQSVRRSEVPARYGFVPSPQATAPRVLA